MKKIYIAMCLMLLSVGAFAKAQKDTTKVVPFDRGIGMSRSVFIPKGTVSFGTSFSYSTYDVGNLDAGDSGFKALFGLVNGLSGNVVTGGVSPHASYFIIDNLAVGARFNYKRAKFNVGAAKIEAMGTSLIEIGGDNALKSLHYMKDTYMGAVFARYYIPFGTSRRFAMFAELAASGGYAEAQSYQWKKDDDNEIRKYGTHQDIYDFEIGVIPGITAFVTNNVALEVSVGLVGLNYQKVVQRTNQVEQSVMESSGANYKINLLNISLGITFNLPTGDHSLKKVKAYKQARNEK